MKKILFGILAIFALVSLVSCGSKSSEAPAAKWKVSNDAIVAYDFEAPVKDGIFGQNKQAVGRYGKGLLFDGAKDYMKVSASGSAITIAAWVQPQFWKDGSRIFEMGNSDSYISVFYDPKARQLGVADNGGDSYITTAVPGLGKWTHVVLVVEGGNASLYTNGKLIKKAATKVAVGGDVYIGRSITGSEPYFGGVMDDVVVTKGAITAISSIASGIEK